MIYTQYTFDNKDYVNLDLFNTGFSDTLSFTSRYRDPLLLLNKPRSRHLYKAQLRLF